MALKLITPAAGLPVTLARAKAFLRVEGTDEDDLIGALLGAAVGHLEQVTGRRFGTETWALCLDSFSDTILLQYGPVQSVTGIEYLDQAGATQQAPAELWREDLVSDPARIVRRPGASWPQVLDAPNAVTVRFVAGYADLPLPLQQAVLLLVGHWYTNREAATTGTISTELPLGVMALIHNYRSWLH